MFYIIIGIRGIDKIFFFILGLKPKSLFVLILFFKSNYRYPTLIAFACLVKKLGYVSLVSLPFAVCFLVFQV